MSAPESERIYCECGQHNDASRPMIKCNEVGGCTAFFLGDGTTTNV